MEEGKKNCPFCGEEIDANVLKCPHCDEDLQKQEIEENKEIFRTCKIKNYYNFVKILCGIIILLAIFFILSNKYKIETSGDEIYLLNQITGNVKLIKNSNLIETVNVKKISTKEKNQLSQLKELTNITIKGSIDCNLKYLWRDGKLYYKFSASPYEGELKKARERGYGNFTIVLQDSEDFTIKEIVVNINSMTRIVDDSETAYKMEYNSSIPLSYDEIKNITNWTLIWNF